MCDLQNSEKGWMHMLISVLFTDSRPRGKAWEGLMEIEKLDAKINTSFAQYMVDLNRLSDYFASKIIPRVNNNFPLVT